MPDIVTGKVFVDGEKGITATKLNQIQSLAVIQPSFVGSKPTASSIAATDQLLVLQTSGSYAQAPFSTVSSSVAGQLPLASTTQNGMLRQISGNTTDVVDGTNNCVNPAANPGITQMRLRSFSAVGNPGFECDQRQCGTALTNPANGTFIQDRWSVWKSGTLTGTVNTALQSVPTAPIVIPGTNFAITQAYQRFTVGTAQATLAAGDWYGITQSIEGPQWRELSMDVHSPQVLVRLSVAGTFSLRLRDPTTTHSLVQLCTIASANTWTLIKLPNLPVWVGTYSAAPGGVGYNIDIFLAVGSNYLTSASNAWQTGDIKGVTGMSNFLATAGATFDLAFVQHEPGPLCTTLIDKPFTANYDECLRYFCKSYDYITKPGTGASPPGYRAFHTLNNGSFCMGSLTFPKPLAKDPPTVSIWAPDGSVSQVALLGGGNAVISAIAGAGNTGFAGLQFGAAQAVNTTWQFHYAADTGW